MTVMDSRELAYDFRVCPLCQKKGIYANVQGWIPPPASPIRVKEILDGANSAENNFPEGEWFTVHFSFQDL